MITAEHMAAAAKHGRRDCGLELLIIQPIMFGEEAPALNVDCGVPPAFELVHGLRALLKCALRTTREQRTFHQAHVQGCYLLGDRLPYRG